MQPTAITEVLFFASLREAMRVSRLQLPLDTSITVTALVQRIATQSDVFTTALAERELLVAINERLAQQDSIVNPGDTVALFPPVTGG